ncbi:hypothetical protein [Nocardiopsis sp. B62]|uniref:hypothetical protein n=1 Tax=Nocardiopsis sp. B62 TaxID=2824874 RepID=UPI001B368662|nr:hypothetical protein [Nocardiopsis sp. B62]MBQ1083056.1 hypothetical protein [Nocardiopsis sp. B62]
MSGTNFLQLHGSLALRAELSSWLARSCGVLAAPDRSIVTGGVHRGAQPPGARPPGPGA